MIAQMKAEVRGIAEPSYGQILQIADLAWQLFMPQYRKISAPVMADAYVRAYRQANAGDVPISVIYDLAEKHAEKTGDYFHASSRDALADGFNSLVNRRLPARAAADRVFDAYGLTPRQMRGYVNNKQLMTPVDSPIPFDVKGRAREYIDRSFTTRVRKLSEQEEHNIDEQAKQFAWMWLQDKGRLNERAQKIWITAKDERVCPVCGPLHGQKVLVSEQFKTPEGDFWSPGVHPNCRCVVRLIENRFTLEKRYDIHQPRGKDGRWAVGQSSSRQLAHKVNALASPSAKVHEGEVIHRSVQALGYVKEPRHILTPIKHRDREMAQLARGASAWSRRGANVQRTRKLAAEENQYYAGKMRMARTDKSLKKLITAVESAPANSPELYRGMVVSPEHLKELKAGSSFQLPMSSFTESQPFSESFARKWGPMIAQAHAKREGKKLPHGMQPVVMVLEPKANALNISPIVSERQAEWIAQGEFLITKVGDDKGLTVVHLKQTKHRVSKADDDWNAKLHPRGGDPENPGRFSRRPRPQALPAVFAEPVEPEADEEELALEEKPEPAAKPAPEETWGGGGGWGSGGGQAQAWGGTEPGQSGGWGGTAQPQQAQTWGAPTPTPAPAAAKPVEQTWGAEAKPEEEAWGVEEAKPGLKPAAAAPAPAPEPEPMSEPKVAKTVDLAPDGRAFYRLVDHSEGTGYFHQFSGDRFGTLDEVKSEAARRRTKAVDEVYRRVAGTYGQASIKVHHDDENTGRRMYGLVDADTFREVLGRVADQAQEHTDWDDINSALQSIPVEWTDADLHQSDFQGHITAAQLISQQGVDTGDFVFKILATSKGHNDAELTKEIGHHSRRLGGEFRATPDPEGMVEDDTGKLIPVIYLEPMTGGE